MLYGYLMGQDLMKWGVLQMIGGVGLGLVGIESLDL